MCPIREHEVNGKPVYVVPSDYGLNNSDGRIGEPIPSESGAPESAPEDTPASVDEAGVRMVRHHRGRSDISVSFLHLTEACQGTFTALKGGPLEGYTVTLSCALTSTKYADLIRMLETTPSTPGKTVSVVVKFEPTTPNLVPSTIAPSTS